MAHIVQCRLCKVRFDTEKEPFTLIGKKSYYHQECYTAWVKKRNDAKVNEDEDFWKESVIDYLYRDVKMLMDFSKIENQWKNFTKPDRKMTPKGIYFALRYYYEVQKGDKEKALGGIGIVANIYSDAARYWTELENRKAGTIEAIVAQIKAREDREVVSIVRHDVKKDKSKFNLDDV
jgi:predicted DNA binding protein